METDSNEWIELSELSDFLEKNMKLTTGQKAICVVCILFWLALGVAIGHYVWKRK